jgi:hypothetical protein
VFLYSQNIRHKIIPHAHNNILSEFYNNRIEIITQLNYLLKSEYYKLTQYIKYKSSVCKYKGYSGLSISRHNIVKCYQKCNQEVRKDGS